jgi:aspartate-semialdehyde dehydrogenase
VLGATSLAGQTLVRLLADHPWFDVVAVATPNALIGQRLADVRGADSDVPSRLASLELQPCTPAAVRAPIVLSVLDGEDAESAEPAFARDGRIVVSNAERFRLDPDIPLIIPEINASHLDAIPTQRRTRRWTGAIVTTANCAATGPALALAPLHEAFGVDHVFVTTLQAVSGAGYPGVPSLDVIDNAVPFIGDEEPKIEREIPKLLGVWADPTFVAAPVSVSAQTNRVAVTRGHLTCLAVKLRSPATPAEAIDALTVWRGAADVRGLPSAPTQPLVVTTSTNRPQPRRDAGAGRSMTVTVGRVRTDPILDLRFVTVVDNLVRVAAGGVVLTAELLAKRGALPAPG